MTDEKIIPDRNRKGMLQRFKAVKKLIMRDDSYLALSGWMESVMWGYPCDSEGSPLPWMNYGIIALLQDRLKDNMNLFEYGSGYSTLFYARKVKQVISVEYNREWYDRITKIAHSNVRIIYQENDIDGKYCRTIREQDMTFDVVVVDGRDRNNCLRQAVDCLTVEGVIVLDNSERQKYSDGISYVRNKGFRALDFQGMVPASRRFNQSTVFYRDGNCLGI